MMLFTACIWNYPVFIIAIELYLLGFQLILVSYVYILLRILQEILDTRNYENKKEEKRKKRRKGDKKEM